jgi:hypothetical protein
MRKQSRQLADARFRTLLKIPSVISAFITSKNSVSCPTLLRSEIHKLIKLIWNKEELPHQWKESIVVPIHKKGDKTECSSYRGISFPSNSHKILSNILLARLTPYADEIIGDNQCDFGVIDQRLIEFSISGRYWRKMGA